MPSLRIVEADHRLDTASDRTKPLIHPRCAIRSVLLLAIAALLLTSEIAAAQHSCKAVSSCEEAVEMWCSGYSRADGDDDGIPCENICYSREQVDQIRSRIGC